MRNPEEVNELEKQFIKPILNELSIFFESKKEHPNLKNYYKSFVIERKSEINGQIEETYILLLFVGSFDDLITDKFDESICTIRDYSGVRSWVFCFTFRFFASNSLIFSKSKK
jgi:hypothetical protein